MGQRAESRIALAKLTKTFVAKEMGLTPNGLANYLNGKSEMPALKAARFCQITGTNLIWLITGTGPVDEAESFSRSIKLLDALERLAPEDPNHKLSDAEKKESGLLLFALIGEVKKLFESQKQVVDQLDDLQQKILSESIL